MKERNSGVSFLIFAGILVGLYLLLKDKTGQVNYQPEYAPEPIRLRSGGIRLVDAPEPEGRRYRNEETWNIEWNADGLPSKVTIHRDATQS
jgi:hypothetical protein